MGLDRSILYSSQETPSWEAILTQLERVGESAQLRMIDGLPSFSDENPEADWKELRISTAAGMITLRREPGRISAVIWGNADSSLADSWVKVIWACAAGGNGSIQTPEGAFTAEQFAQSMGLQPG